MVLEKIVAQNFQELKMVLRSKEYNKILPEREK